LKISDKWFKEITDLTCEGYAALEKASSKQASKINATAVAFPVSVTCGIRTFGTVDFLRYRAALRLWWDFVAAGRRLRRRIIFVFLGHHSFRSFAARLMQFSPTPIVPPQQVAGKQKLAASSYIEECGPPLSLPAWRARNRVLNSCTALRNLPLTNACFVDPGQT